MPRPFTNIEIQNISENYQELRKYIFQKRT